VYANLLKTKKYGGLALIAVEQFVFIEDAVMLVERNLQIKGKHRRTLKEIE